jgi:hypothetical protein
MKDVNLIYEQGLTILDSSGVVFANLKTLILVCRSNNLLQE